MEYKLIKSSKGTRYMKDGKFVAKDKVPISVLERLGKEEQISTSKDCIFCGVPSKLTRLLNSQPLYLCNEHYYDSNVTLGKIAQRVREGTSHVQTS